MITYALYLESGPKQRKTMAHVLDLLGCIARGPTTEAALEAAPAAIQAYLAFLRGLGEPVDPQAPFATQVVEHVMEGYRLGEGNPASGFEPDFQPLEPAGQALYLRRLEGLKEELLSLTGSLSDEQLLADPPAGNRTLYDILVHVAEAQTGYMSYTVGKVEGLNQALKPVYEGLAPATAWTALAEVWRISLSRLGALTANERVVHIQHGQETWSARRGFRRMLEHAWEHCQEIEALLRT